MVSNKEHKETEKVVRMNKKELIEQVSKINPQRSKASWSKEDIEYLQSLYDEGVSLGLYKEKLI